jgi:hypothetical protein
MPMSPRRAETLAWVLIYGGLLGLSLLNYPPINTHY